VGQAGRFAHVIVSTQGARAHGPGLCSSDISHSTIPFPISDLPAAHSCLGLAFSAHLAGLAIFVASLAWYE
jgi:hypothetical protein